MAGSPPSEQAPGMRAAPSSSCCSPARQRRSSPSSSPTPSSSSCAQQPGPFPDDHHRRRRQSPKRRQQPQPQQSNGDPVRFALGHCMYRFCSRNLRFLLCCQILPLTFVLQWQMQSHHDKIAFFGNGANEAAAAQLPTRRQQPPMPTPNAHEDANAPRPAGVDSISNDGHRAAGPVGRGAAAAAVSRRNHDDTHIGPDLMSYQPHLNPVVPRAVADELLRQYAGAAASQSLPPPSLKPRKRRARKLPVAFVGTDESNRAWTEAVALSDFVRVVRTVSYDPAARRSRVANVARTEAAADQDDDARSYDPTRPLVYIVDWMALSRDCHVLRRIFSPRRNDDFSVPRSSDRNGDRAHLLYLDTSRSSRDVLCAPGPFDAPGLLPPANRTRYAKSGIVSGRYWNHTKQWTETGKIADNKPLFGDDAALTGGPKLHAPQHLRESFVKQLRNVTATAGVNVTDLARYAGRTTDVAHFWRKGGNLEYAFLRRRVSADIAAFAAEEGRVVRRWLVRPLGGADAAEASRVAPEYVRQMVATKVVVVAQHDEWEDHYRLTEALASGAMVLSDAMLAPPPGLKDKVNIAFYDSSSSLREQLRYYLRPENEKERLDIAQRGMEFALYRQRGCHLIERLLLGRALTDVGR